MSYQLQNNQNQNTDNFSIQKKGWWKTLISSDGGFRNRGSHSGEYADVVDFVQSWYIDMVKKYSDNIKMILGMLNGFLFLAVMSSVVFSKHPMTAQILKVLNMFAPKATNGLFGVQLLLMLLFALMVQVWSKYISAMCLLGLAIVYFMFSNVITRGVGTSGKGVNYLFLACSIILLAYVATMFFGSMGTDNNSITQQIAKVLNPAGTYLTLVVGALTIMSAYGLVGLSSKRAAGQDNSIFGYSAFI